jgi:hypothetical protein
LSARDAMLARGSTLKSASGYSGAECGAAQQQQRPRQLRLRAAGSGGAGRMAAGWLAQHRLQRAAMVEASTGVPREKNKQCAAGAGGAELLPRECLEPTVGMRPTVP